MSSPQSIANGSSPTTSLASKTACPFPSGAPWRTVSPTEVVIENLNTLAGSETDIVLNGTIENPIGQTRITTLSGDIIAGTTRDITTEVSYNSSTGDFQWTVPASQTTGMFVLQAITALETKGVTLTIVCILLWGGIVPTGKRRLYMAHRETRNTDNAPRRSPAERSAR